MSMPLRLRPAEGRRPIWNLVNTHAPLAQGACGGPIRQLVRLPLSMFFPRLGRCLHAFLTCLRPRGMAQEGRGNLSRPVRTSAGWRGSQMADDADGDGGLVGPEGVKFPAEPIEFVEGGRPIDPQSGVQLNQWVSKGCDPRNFPDPPPALLTTPRIQQRDQRPPRRPALRPAVLDQCGSVRRPGLRRPTADRITACRRDRATTACAQHQ